jgi:hypothetical protein
MQNCDGERAQAAVVGHNDVDCRRLSGRELLKGRRHRCPCGIKPSYERKRPSPRDDLTPMVMAMK